MTPDGWKTRPLLELCDRITDGSHFSPTPVEDGVPIATVANMRGREIDIRSCAQISKTDFESLERNGCRPRAGDVLFSKDGSIGKVLVMQTSPRLVLLSSVAILKPREDQIDSWFLGQSLKWSRNLRTLHGMRTGTAIKRVVLRDLRRLRLAVPPLPEQQAIAAILSAVDEVIEKTQAVIDQARIVKKGLMQELLSRETCDNKPMNGNDEGGSGAFESGSLKTLDQLATYYNGYAFKPSDWTDRGLPIVRIAQLTDPSAKPNYYGGRDVRERHLIDTGDLLFSWSATLKVLKWDRGPAVLNQHIFKVVEAEGILRDYLRHVLDHLLPTLMEHSHGSTMKHIRKGVLREHAVHVPPVAEQQRIAAVLSAMGDAMSRNKALVQQVRVVKSALMSVLLTGQLRVTPDSEPE